MTKTLIAYASKSGTAQEAATKIAEQLTESTLVDLTKQTPDLEDFDVVVIGSGVRMGALHKKAESFITSHEKKLASMPAAYFITNCFVDQATEILEKGIPENLRSKALFVGTLGGRIEIDKLKGFDKTIAKMAMKAASEGQEVAQGLNEHAIEQIVSAVQDHSNA